MVLWIRRTHEPDDPDKPFAELASSDSVDSGDLPLVSPDYASIPDDAHIPEDPDERRLVWPGPALVMPAGLLPDGKPYGPDEMENASRIEGKPVRHPDHADASVRAYMKQQNRLRKLHGIPRAVRDENGLHDPPGALEQILRLHELERQRRSQQQFTR